MQSLRDFWRRHRRKIFVTVGVLGSGYLLYKLYDANRRRITDLEKEHDEWERIIKNQMQAHFNSIQMTADTTTLPHVMHDLSCRIAEELDHAQLIESLQKAKGQPNSLTASEKLELWDRIKILSFTRMVLSLWAVTMLSLYIRVLVNILGRYLYIDTAHNRGSSFSLEDGDIIDGDDERKFLATADFLSNHGLATLISDMRAAATEVLKGKQVTSDFFNTTILHETIVQILERFKSIRSFNDWVIYFMPENARFGPRSENEIPSDMTKIDRLMMEMRSVLASAEFENVVEKSLTAVLTALVEDMAVQSGGSLTSGVLLAKLLPRVAQMGPVLLDEPSKNRYIRIIQSIPEVDVFFTLIYTNIPAS